MVPFVAIGWLLLKVTVSGSVDVLSCREVKGSTKATKAYGNPSRENVDATTPKVTPK